ncbi:cytochrome b [Pelistega europaea]|uniref:cytochrome b n=1 Tax=Pelistega europaea TaxID=106147 RepID=UPI001C114C6F|nr:cytochrome b [Pelistega europaea]
MNNSQTSCTEPLGKVTIVLHWLIAIVMIGMITLGIYIGENKAFSLMPLHKSIGILIFVFVVWRLILRLTQGFPKPLGNPPALQHLVAMIVHWILLLGTVLFPLSGMVMSAMGGRGLAMFGIQLVASNIVDGKPVALNESLAGLAHTIHTSIVPVMIAAIVLHILGALYHHFIVKDDTVKRMTGRV